MQFKTIFSSAEVLTGIGMLVAGLCGVADGRHDLLSLALAPFGAGLILSDSLSRMARAARERITVRKDGD